MRKLIVWLLVITMIAGTMTACDGKKEPTGTTPSASTPQQTQTNPTDSTKHQTEEVAIGHEDTYWVAETYVSDDGEGAEGPLAIEPALWALDLLIRVDGTACFRDIHGGVSLMDDSFLNLVWERTSEGEFLFYSVLYVAPILRGAFRDGVLTLDYRGTTLTMRQKPIPQTVGQRYVPAELVGTWLMVSGETEGDAWEAMPGQLSSIVFSVTSYDGPLILVADMEERDYYGDLQYSSYAQATEILDTPLYEGCENEAWSVRIGPASAQDANGYPTKTEFYATLLNADTLLLQRYYTLDGYPVVSYQTYRRFPDLVSWMSPLSMDLDFSNWVCTGYEDLTGEEAPLPSEMEGFSVVLDPDGTCSVHYGDESVQDGTWVLSDGGVLLLRGAETAEEPFWFGGAVTGYWVETEKDGLETYQMVLYYDGGLLKLSLNSYG